MARYGDDAVFMDIVDIPYGKDFRVHIREVVVESDVLLVIVGERWLGVDEGGRRGMDDATDFVRVEVETALSTGIPIVPVLAGSAKMPQPAQLPESLKNFAFINAAPVDTGRDFHQHMERLIRAIDQIPDRRATRPATSRSWSDVTAPAGDADKPDFAVFRDAEFAPELVVIPAGEFMMGSPPGEEGRFDYEGPQHRVTIGRRFAIGRYPATFDEYDRFCEAKGREKPADEGWGRARRPVINVGWQDAQAYVAWLSQETGKTYRLPSEAEWEYACRAGTTTRYSFGDAITPQNTNYSDSGLGPSEIGAYPANPWGLHDMHGNVWECVEDQWHNNYQGAPADASAWKDPGPPPNPRPCVSRGGSWFDLSGSCRSACRGGLDADIRSYSAGFRVARTLS